MFYSFWKQYKTIWICLYTNVLSNIINKSQKVETIQMLITVNRETKCSISIHIILPFKKEWNTNTWYHMDQPWKHVAKWRKTATKDYISYDSTHMKVQNRKIYSGCLGLGDMRIYILIRGYIVFSEVMKMF